jgi:hypothetical protein
MVEIEFWGKDAIDLGKTGFVSIKGKKGNYISSALMDR